LKRLNWRHVPILVSDLTALRTHRHLRTLSIPGPTCVQLSFGYAALTLFTRIVRFLSFSCTQAALNSHPRPRTGPLLFLLLVPPSTQARAGSAPWPTLSPPRDPPVFFFHVASTSRLLGCARVSYIYSTPMQPAKRTADRMQIKAARTASGHSPALLFPHTSAVLSASRRCLFCTATHDTARDVTSIGPMLPLLSPTNLIPSALNAAQCHR